MDGHKKTVSFRHKSVAACKNSQVSTACTSPMQTNVNEGGGGLVVDIKFYPVKELSGREIVNFLLKRKCCSWAVEMAQLEEYLSHKHEDLSSNLRTHIKKKVSQK